MPRAKNMHDYHQELQKELENSFQRQALENFTQDYRQSRAQAFAGFDLQALVREIAKTKDKSIAALDELYDRFKAKAREAGAKVHLAQNAQEANEIISQIARDNKCTKLIKSKSMTSEEIRLNDFLEDQGLQVTETDLGEWIIQLRNEGPTHMVMPAIHLSREQIRDLFSKVTGKPLDKDIAQLVRVARQELWQRFIQADMGITGANFALADTGTIGIVTNEGNARLVSTLPRVHVALLGLDKLLLGVHDALIILKGLTRNATAQTISSYVTWITGANECSASPSGQKEMHIVFLDNGRSALARDPVFSRVLRCVRCGACANVCPIYKLVGGKAYGHIYIGAIGLILTYFYHGREKDRHLIQNCLSCQACKEVCIAGIDLPRLIEEVRILIQKDKKPGLFNMLASHILSNRKLFHGLLRTASFAQSTTSADKPAYRHLPEFIFKKHNFKSLPALAPKPFRDLWPKFQSRPSNFKYKVALFSGCLQDFVYPEQLKAGVEFLLAHQVQVEFPMAQGCCGLPLQMLGEKQAATEIALHNLDCFDPEEYDFILTLCASCASHLKNNYPALLQSHSSKEAKSKQFSDKIIDFSSFVYKHLQLPQITPEKQSQTFAYHAPCHLCRGLGVHQTPKKLLQKAGLSYIPAPEEESCCGLGGTYSFKFPEISREILYNKLDQLEQSKAELLLTDCPGCILQLRGGAHKMHKNFQVKHTAEILSALKNYD